VNGSPQTLGTSYQYDRLKRITQTTYPDGSSTQIQYNSIGKKSVTVDQLSRQTSHQYDLMGRAPRTTYPVTTTESSTYMPKATASRAPTAAGRRSNV
jgi:YD repeat-containing protein